MNPYDPAQPPTPVQAPQTPVRLIPFWIMRAFFAVAGFILLADALTRNRPEIRPTWLGVLTVPSELVAVLLLLFIAWKMQPATAVAPNQVSN